MAKKIVKAMVALLALAGIGFGVWRARLRDDAPADRLILYGNVDIREVELAFNAAERIVTMTVQEGESVREGDLLGKLDTRRFDLAVELAKAEAESQRQILSALEAGTRSQEIRVARAEVESAAASLSLADVTDRRMRFLAEAEDVPQQAADEARAGAESARARLNAAEEALSLALIGPREEDIAAARAALQAREAALRLAERDREYAFLHSPSDGVIRNRILEPGDMASPQRAAYTLALADPVWVRAYASETDLGKLKPGMSAFVFTDSYPEKRYKGWVGYISPTAEFTPKTVETPEVRLSLVYQVRIYVENPENELRLGMPATVEIPLAEDAPPGEGR